MAAWAAGIVVVTSAGNQGPQPMTVGVPGNVPYFLTVGAMTDNYTPTNATDDQLAVFSAAGPTFEGFVKPDLVAPGGHALGLMSKHSLLARTHRQYADGNKYFTMSGTSQAAAMVSGAAALLLQQRPGLSPADVKCLLTRTARPAVTSSGQLAYSIYQQGTGTLNVYAASQAALPAGACANRGLDIGADLAGTKHFGGPADRNAAGSYYIHGLDAHVWSEGYIWSTGYIWTENGFVWVDGYIWTEGSAFVEGYIWSEGGYPWPDGYVWTAALTEPASVNVWVDQM
jgi:subtilisin family serine protease